jgi:hypothetical protein
MPTILDKIVTTKRDEIERARTVLPERELRAQLADSPPVRDFFAPLAAGGPIKLIAEVKKASPSAGVIRADFDPVLIAQTYEAHGASCISVLTDESYFQGRIEYLRQIREAVGLPVYCAGVTANSPARNGPGTVGHSVTMGGMTIAPGDIVIGDNDGIVIIPLAHAEAVLDKLKDVKAAEAALEAKVKAGLEVPDFVQKILESDRVVER